MTVKDLRDLIVKLPDDMPVVVHNEDGEVDMVDAEVQRIHTPLMAIDYLVIG